MSSADLMNFTVLIDRMKQATGLPNVSAIAKALNITPQAMSNFKDKGKIPADQIIQFALTFKLSVDWLLTGEGPMRIGEKADICYSKHVREDCAQYHTERDPEIHEIVELLEHDLPELKKYLLKFLRGTKERKEGAQGLGLPDQKLNEEG